MAQQRSQRLSPGCDGSSSGNCTNVCTTANNRRASHIYTAASDADLYATSSDIFAVRATDDSVVARVDSAELWWRDAI